MTDLFAVKISSDFLWEASALKAFISNGIRLSAVATAVRVCVAACLQPWATRLHPG
jgi:hypothetical protein